MGQRIFPVVSFLLSIWASGRWCIDVEITALFLCFCDGKAVFRETRIQGYQKARSRKARRFSVYLFHAEAFVNMEGSNSIYCFAVSVQY